MRNSSSSSDDLPCDGEAGGDRASACAIARSLGHVGGGMLGTDAAGRLRWSVGRPFGLDFTPGIGHDLFSLVPPDCSETLRGEIGLMAANGSGRFTELDWSTAGGRRHCEIWLDTDIADDADRTIVVTVMDTTERRSREQTLKVLLREVAHRSKNLLAIIQSVANQTGRFSGTIDDFLTRFRGRIQSMASSQDLITSTNWRGASFRDLVRGQVVRYVADPERAVRVTGPDLSLNPNASLHLGLALHELIVNSVSHGQLADPGGFIEISVRPDESGDAGVFVLEWRERVTRSGTEEAIKRFGSAALERVVPAALNGTAEFHIGEHELRYRLVIPAENFVQAELTVSRS